MQRIFKNFGTNLEVQSVLAYKDEGGQILSFSKQTFYPVKTQQECEKLYNSLNDTLEVFRPKETDKKYTLEFAVHLKGKIHREPCDREFVDMEALQAFLIEKGLVNSANLQLKP